MLPAVYSVNQIAPSLPGVMKAGPLTAVGVLNR